MTSLPSHSGKRPAISHHQSSIMSEPPAPSNIESNASQPAAAPVVYSGQELRTDIQAYPVDTSALQANSNNETTPNNFKNPIELEKGDASSFRRSLFSSPKSSGPLGTDIASSIILPENDSVLVDLDEPGFTCLDKDIRINVSNSLEAETIADGQATERPSTPARKSLPPPPVTPVHDTIGKDASFSRSPSNLFKTPSNASAGTPSNQRVTSSDFFSFSAKKLLHGASANMTPSRGGGRTLQTDNDRFSPQIPRLLRTIYGSNSPENEDFSDMFDVNMEHLFNDCCPGFPIHREECPKRAIMMSQPEFDEADFRTGFPGTDEDWAAADAFFNSSGVTGFTPRKRVSANSMQQEEEPVLKD